MGKLVRITLLALFAIFFAVSSLTSRSADNIIYVQPTYKNSHIDTHNKQIISYNEDDFECLAKNIFFEAGVESTAGKLAVANVTKNRVLDKRFPNNYCGVVKQAKRYRNGAPIRNRCAFSWYCDGKPDEPYDGENWKISREIAHFVLSDEKHLVPDITDGSTHYHADYVSPYWKYHFEPVVKIGRHIFYR